MEQQDKTNTHQEEIVCRGCSADLHYSPGTDMLKCPYCGAENPIESSDEPVEEIDLVSFLSNLEDSAEVEQVLTVSCPSCSAQTTFDPNIVSDFCAFCGTPITVVEGTETRLIKPKSLLPFKIDQKEAFTRYKDWLHSLWWAPNKLKTYARQQEKLAGTYIPYWTYDSDTYSRYKGERGDDYYETETYTEMEDGKSVTKTRTITKTRWTYVSGHISEFFDDVLVMASGSLPTKQAVNLEPWDLENLIPYEPKYLSGFRAESYQTDIKQGFEEAKDIMAKRIERLVRRHIGGDHQRIRSVDTTHSKITFKHILLPVWISAYKYSEKTYRFLVNARTGEVQGERPYSWVKIGLAVLAVVGVAASIYLYMQYGDQIISYFG